MADITRRKFLQLAATGAAGVVVASASVGGLMPRGAAESRASGSMQFVAHGPLPPAKLSPIATLVVRGHASPGSPASGQVTTQVLPGHPPTSEEPLPRMTRVGRVERVVLGDTVRIAGQIDDVSHASGRGPSSSFVLVIDPGARTATARIHGVEYPLKLVDYRQA